MSTEPIAHPEAPLDGAGVGLLTELEPVVEELLGRHLGRAKEWFPHEYVPWGRGRDFEAGEEWDPNEVELPDAVRSALFLNLLTEDNLPYYFAHIERIFGDGAWGEWARRWTAEEGRHAIVIRDYLTVTRTLDPKTLERARMTQVSSGVAPEPETVADTLAYVALQELATRISHINTGKALEKYDRIGYEIMARVAADENLHYLFYRDVTKAAIELDPSAVVHAIERQIRLFKMPGIGVPDFDTHAAQISQAGIYDLLAFHDGILKPVVLAGGNNGWNLENIKGLSPEAEKAREKTLIRIGRIGVAAKRLAQQRADATGRLDQGAL